MKRLIPASVVALALLAAPAQAQIKPTVGGEPDGKPAAGDRGPAHGSRVTLGLKDGKKVTGTVVRADADALYVRTAPGQAPRRVARADVTETQRIKAVGADADAGPEIQPIEVWNGDVRTVRYVAPNLSREELARLNDLAQAEADVAEAESLAARNERHMRTARDLEEARTRAQIAFFNYSAQTSQGFFPATVVTYPQFGIDWGAQGYYYGPTAATAYTRAGIPVDFGWGDYRFAGGFVTSPAVSPALGSTPESAAQAATGAPQAAGQGAPQALAAARARLAAARRAAVYDEGRLVAVSLDQQADEGYKAGDRVTVTLKSGKTVSGTVERADDERIVLRTQQAGPATTIRMGSVDMIEPQAGRPGGKE